MKKAKQHAYQPTTIKLWGSVYWISVDSGNSGPGNMAPYDVFVCDLAEGVHHHPTGKGAQRLTHVVRHALQHIQTNVKLSDVKACAGHYNITVLITSIHL